MPRCHNEKKVQQKKKNQHFFLRRPRSSPFKGGSSILPLLESSKNRKKKTLKKKNKKNKKKKNKTKQNKTKTITCVHIIQPELPRYHIPQKIRSYTTADTDVTKIIVDIHQRFIFGSPTGRSENIFEPKSASAAPYCRKGSLFCGESSQTEGMHQILLLRIL